MARCLQLGSAGSRCALCHSQSRPQGAGSDDEDGKVLGGELHTTAGLRELNEAGLPIQQLLDTLGRSLHAQAPEPEMSSPGRKPRLQALLHLLVSCGWDGRTALRGHCCLGAVASRGAVQHGQPTDVRGRGGAAQLLGVAQTHARTSLVAGEGAMGLEGGWGCLGALERLAAHCRVVDG